MIRRNELETKIIQLHPEIKLVNLKNLNKEQLEQWLQNGEVCLSQKTLIKIFSERNERANINLKLNRENFGLRATINSFTKDLTNWSKSEILQQFKNLFGLATKADDDILGEIGAVSKESVREDLAMAEKIIDDVKDIGIQYNNKYKS